MTLNEVNYLSWQVWRRLAGQALAFVLVFVVVFVATLEGAFRLRYGAPFDYERFYQDDPRLGWAHVPGVVGTYLGQEFHTEIAFNRSGLRGPDRDNPKPPGVKRILVLGDSFTAALEVPEQQTWVRLLEQKLNIALSGQCKVETVNAGVQGYGTDQLLDFLQTQGKTYQPDLVLYAFSITDPFNNMTAHLPGRAFGKPYAVLQDGRLAMNGIPVPHYAYNYWQMVGAEPTYIATLPEEAPTFRRTLRSFSSLWSVLEWTATENSRRAAIKNLDGSVWGIYQATSTPFWEQAWSLTEAIVAEMHTESRAQHSDFAILLVPERELVTDLLSKMGLKNGLLEKALDSQRPIALLGELSRRLAIPVLNPVPSFVQAEGQDGRFWFPIDGHLNKTGHEALADYLSKRLLSSGQVKCP